MKIVSKWKGRKEILWVKEKQDDGFPLAPETALSCTNTRFAWAAAEGCRRRGGLAKNNRNLNRRPPLFIFGARVRKYLPCL